MSNQQKSNKRKRTQASGSARQQPSQKKQKPTRQNRKRKAKRGRAAAAAGAGEQAFVAAAYATSQRTGQAQIFRNGMDSCRIIHRELIGSITGSVAFAVFQAFALNPGLAATFPWLSNEAAGWEKYRFNGLRFCYYTRTGSNVPGSMMLVPDYDASDAAPASEVAASSYEDTEEDAPWKDIMCLLKTAEMHGDMKEKWIRTGALPANADVKTFDAGNFFACTTDGTAVNWGKLWVEYDVTLFTPHTPPGGFQAAGTLMAAGGTIAAATPFGAAPVATGSVILSAVAGVVTVANVQIGQEICLASEIIGTVITGYQQGSPVGMTIRSDGNGNLINAAATNAALFVTYTVTALNPTLTYAVTATTVTSCNLVVTVLTPVPSF